MNIHLKELLLPTFVLLTLGGTVVVFTRLITEYILKKRMIDKGFVSEDSQSIFKKHAGVESKYSSLKWGLIIFFAGLSLIVMEYVPHHPESPLPYGIFALAVSLGFLVYYFMVKRELK